MSRDSFFKGALYLTSAGIIVKIMGSANRIILSRLLGGEGIGLYQMAYPIYLLSLGFSSAGLPVAISVLVAEKVAIEDYRGARRIFRISLALLAMTGFLFSLLLYYGAHWLVVWHIIRDARAYYAIIVLAPAIFFVTVMSSYRGYFQGCQTMLPTALSQVLEQFVRIVTMLSLVFYLLPGGLEYAAAGASFGAVPGAAAGLLVLLYYDYRQKWFLNRQIKLQKNFRIEPLYKIIVKMIQLALPVSLAHIIMPTVASIDLIIVPLRLESAGYTIEQATEFFGYLTGMAVTLVNVPTIITGALAASLVPDIARSETLNQTAAVGRKLEMAIQLANMITIPSAVGLYFLASPISLMLYGTTHAGPVTSILAIGIVFLGIQQVTTGVLQGLGHTMIPVMTLLVAAIIKIFLNYILTALPNWGIEGAAWATVTDYAIAAFFNLLAVQRYALSSWPVKRLGAISIAAVLMGVGVTFSYHFSMIKLMNNTMACLIAIVAGIIIYSISLAALGGIRLQDMERIPKIGFPISKFFTNFTIRR